MIRVIPSRAILVGLYMLLVFALSSIPGQEIRRFGFSWEIVNAAHVPRFAGLSVATAWSIRGGRALAAACESAVCLVFALFDEWHQSFVPGRHFSVYDIGLDAAGIGLGLGIIAGFRAFMGSREGEMQE